MQRGKKTRKMKWIFLVLLMATILSGCGREEQRDEEATDAEQQPPIVMVGDSEQNRGTDVVLVMDESGSMRKADKERLAIEAAKLFVDMEKTSNASIALVEFSNKVVSSGLLDTSQQENKNQLKEVLDGVRYSAPAHTDTGAGLLEAVSVLDGSDVRNKKVIILFTDGKTDIDAGTPNRTIEDSLNDVNTAIQEAAQKGYKIYCIGLNADGKVDEEMLRNIAASTDGQYKIATDVNDLPDFFNSIFAQIDKSEKQNIDEFDADGNYHEMHFTIDNSSVMEANIVILSSMQIEDICLTDPSGTEVDIQENARVEFNNSAKYSLLKLFTPDVGEWSIKVKGVTGDHIKVNLIYNYDIDLIVEVENTVVVKGKKINLRVYLYSRGEKITDKAIYQNMSGYLTIQNKNSQEQQQEELKLGWNGDCLDGGFYAMEIAQYEVSVHVDGSGFYRDSDSFSIEAVKSPPLTKKQFEEIKLRPGKSKVLDLEQYFYDPDGDGEINYSVSNTNEFVKAELQEQTLLLKAEKIGEGRITIIAENGSVEKTEKRITIVVMSFMQAYGKVLLVILAVAFLVWIIILCRRRKRKLYGSFQISVLSAAKNQYGIFDTEEFDILSSISAESVGKRGFALSSLLRLIAGYYMETDEEKKQRFTECLMKMETEAAHVKVFANDAAFSITVKCKSTSVKLMHMNSVTERKEIVVDLNGGNRYGISNVTEQEFGVRFPASENEFEQINIKYKKM